MEATEKYVLVISFVGSTTPSKDFIELVWFLAIREEFQNSGIYVNAIISERALACVDCIERERCFVVIAIRNPAQTPSKDDYYNSLGKIVFKVRENLNYPYIFISKEEVNVSYFPQNE